jgi:hypothetical protein
MSESINDATFARVVWRHLHSYSITNCQSNESLAHLSGDVRQNQMLVRKRDAKHRPGKHHGDGALQFDGFVRIHLVIFTGSTAGEAVSIPSFGKQSASPTE